MKEYILLYTCLLSLCILTGCSDTDTKTTANATVETAKTQKTPPPPESDTVAILNEHSTAAFVRQIKEIHINKNAKNPFDKMVYNKVVAYDYNPGYGERMYNIVTGGKLAPTVINQKELSQEQVDSLTNYLGANSTYGGSTAFCFEPHLGIVFYKDTQVVEHFSICLSCNRLNSSIKIPATEVKKIKIGDNFEYPADGFSKLGRQKLNSLCKQLNFSHCIDNT